MYHFFSSLRPCRKAKPGWAGPPWRPHPAPPRAAPPPTWPPPGGAAPPLPPSRPTRPASAVRLDRAESSRGAAARSTRRSGAGTEEPLHHLSLRPHPVSLKLRASLEPIGKLSLGTVSKTVEIEERASSCRVCTKVAKIPVRALGARLRARKRRSLPAGCLPRV